MTLRVSEVYLSTQGEGPRVGTPTVFVRFGGCNLRCPGWPCDTQHAIDPKYRHEWEKNSYEAVADQIELVSGGNSPNVCFTGGEPMLQQAGDLINLAHELDPIKHRIIEMFSNGTLLYPLDLLDYIHVIMDWKLKGSGEDPYNKNRITNLQNLDEFDAVKFVIKDREDYEQARHIWHEYILPLHDGPETYYGVAWGHLENDRLIDWVLKDGMPWRLNVQVHNHIWDRNKRGI